MYNLKLLIFMHYPGGVCLKISSGGDYRYSPDVIMISIDGPLYNFFAQIRDIMGGKHLLLNRQMSEVKY